MSFRSLTIWIVAAALAGFTGPRTCAQDADARLRDGLFITVPNPVTDQAVSEIKRKVKTAIDKRRLLDVIVFDFNPHDAPAGTTSFGSCYDLADYIHGLPLGRGGAIHPRTVAFVHNQVTNNTVLAVLACGEIVMSSEPDDATQQPRSRLGDVGFNNTALRPKERRDYEEMAENLASPDLVLRMLDPSLPLLRVDTDKGVRIMSPRRIEKWKAEGRTVVAKSPQPVGLEPGKASFDAEKALEFGLCKALYNSRGELRKALGLPRQSVQEDWFSDQQIVAWRIDVTGRLDKGRLDSLRRRISNAVGRGANFLILDLQSREGDTTHVADLAQDLRNLRDKSGVHPIRTVAYIPPGALLGSATYLALACQEIVMGSTATLADFQYLKKDGQDVMGRREEMLLPLAREQDYPELLFKATLEPNLVLYHVRSTRDPADDRLITEDEFQTDHKGPKVWRSLGRIAAPPGELLTIPASMALNFRIAQSADIDNPEQLYAHYGLQPDQVRVSRDDLLDQVAHFFREPIVNFVLIMVGIIGLILELKMPGTTFPGVVAAICFVLFFWAYSFVGEFTMLAVLLFLLGLLLIGLEIFVFPGFGVPGLAGIGLLVTSLVLVTLERWPETSQDWERMGASVTTLALGLVAALAGAFVLAWYLPSMPYMNRLVLNPPGDEAEGDHAAAGGIPLSLLGATGVAATPLRPAGKAQFDDAFLDVIAEDDYVSAGTPIQVIEIEGNRIVVKAL